MIKVPVDKIRIMKLESNNEYVSYCTNTPCRCFVFLFIFNFTAQGSNILYFIPRLENSAANIAETIQQQSIPVAAGSVAPSLFEVCFPYHLAYLFFNRKQFIISLIVGYLKKKDLVGRAKVVRLQGHVKNKSLRSLI